MATTLPKLPSAITLDYQPYGCVTLGNLDWSIEKAKDCNNGGFHHRIVLQGVIVKGQERSYLAGYVSSRDVIGQSRTVYGVTQAEIEKGHIIRVAG